MDTDTQRELAQTFQNRHTETTADPLVLPNSWDAASTIIYEAAGLEAVGTSSAGIAAALGVPDGEHLARDEMLAVVSRIAHGVGIPVSADIEAGYGDTPDDVAGTVRKTIDAGAVGINLEDGTDNSESSLMDTHRHSEKIRAARKTADEADLPLVINGRTDVFWRDVGNEADRIEHAIERANEYYDAGSDCLFIPGVTDAETIAALVDGLDGPLNVLGGPEVPPIPELNKLGVARVSVGSGPMRATLGYLREISTALNDEGTYHQMENAIPYSDLNALLTTSRNHHTE
ncbi:isocitrate lyase/PEP mutase family protein [Halocatena marina]|uniref:isocitrate lyase/PEP mutase family protein n=1 Tax=Halocatena marina TaxID=2934937 RepID=UPI0022251B45|nr:isocitrate lyase/phosphoenolpyruvate mutase family protein [Halocatena marina]